MKFLSKLKAKLKNKTNYDDIYLSQSTSLEEVERRQRELMRGMAPHQRFKG